MSLDTDDTSCGLRSSCPDCARKHLGQAVVLFTETKLGYPLHFWVAIGHMAEAEAELIKDYPKLARRIRAARLQIQEGKTCPNILALIGEITRVSEHS